MNTGDANTTNDGTSGGGGIVATVEELLGVAGLVVEATERDRCLAVLGMCCRAAGTDDGAVVLRAGDGTLRVAAATSDGVSGLQSDAESLARESLLRCVETRTAQSNTLWAGDVPYDGYVARAINSGFHHEGLLPLGFGRMSLGAVVLLARSELGFDGSGLALAGVLAAVAAAMMNGARTTRLSVELAAQLQAALDGRVTIEQAKGILAARDGIGLDAAFGVLRSRARRERRSVADVAGEIASSV